MLYNIFLMSSPLLALLSGLYFASTPLVFLSFKTFTHNPCNVTGPGSNGEEL